MLRRVPLFSAFPEADLKTLQRACRPKRLARGAQLFGAGDPADGFFVIVSGRVKIYQLSAKGDEQILHLYGAGQTFGEAAMWGETSLPAYAEAVEPAVVLHVRRTTLEEMIRTNPKVALEMMAGLSAKLQEFERLIERLSLREVPARLAGILLAMSKDARTNTFRLEQTKRELAAQIGTVAETLSRALKKLQTAGLIEVRGSEIRILDPGGLEELAEG